MWLREYSEEEFLNRTSYHIRHACGTDQSIAPKVMSPQNARSRPRAANRCPPKVKIAISERRNRVMSAKAVSAGPGFTKRAIRI